MLNLSPEIWQQLLDAFNTSRRIWIRYYAATRNEESERVVDPYFLDIYRGSNPYLIGFCHKRQAIRDFRIDRIKNLKILDETFEKDSSFDPKAYLEKRFQNEGGDKLFSVTIWFNPSSAPFIKERRWHTSQKLVEHPDGSLTLHLVVAGLNDLKRWVLGYGKGAIVKEPQELVQLIKREVEEMSQYYQIFTTES
jgi:predicted DNA-binding transcriptional regulator YafY